MTGPVVRVDTTSAVPPYEQIRTQLAADLGVSPGTVARAYRDGTQVAPLPSEPTLLNPHQLATLAGDFTTAARALDADTEAILTAVHKALGLRSETVNRAGPT
ncbi:hypothetical protein [Streptomyces torulosus]|uniref:hypothetical protein n=1 Tax=Streptomyces torulosus TaxID=68276 RepID=UPI0006EB9F4C|nr:hypothetical protein [Streptomyces torulosus]